MAISSLPADADATPPGKLRVVHVITGLSMAGAELMLYRLVVNMQPDRFALCVVSLGDDGPVGDMLRDAGIPVMTLGMKPGRPNPIALMRLRAIMKKADVVQSWMYHADLATALARGALPPWKRTPLAWGIRQTNLDPVSSSRLTIAIARLCARLSWRLPSTIVCCSEAARRVHADLGYDTSKMQVIPNGFDIDRFKPVANGRDQLREELGLPVGRRLVGVIGRFDPQKDHQTFFRAARRIAAACPDVSFVLCGKGTSPDNSTLRAWAAEAGVLDRTMMLGLRPDIERIVSTLDLVVSSSAYGEGFPNVLAEAMACGVPCVATDVGDSAAIIGDTGSVVQIRDDIGLADGALRLLAMPHAEWMAVGARARERIATYFSLSTIVGRYESLYESLGRSA